MDSIDCPENFILDFLEDMVNDGLLYKIINEYRYAISAYHHKTVDNVLVRQHPEVILPRVDNIRPPTTPHCAISEVENVIKFLKIRYACTHFHNTSFRTASPGHYKYIVLGQRKAVFHLSG